MEEATCGIRIERSIMDDLRRQNYAVIVGRELIVSPDLVADRRRLWTDWDDLEADKHLRGGARFRQRRFGLFRYVPASGELELMAPAPYFQSREVNTYAGGISREFAPLLAATVGNDFLRALIHFDFWQFPVSTERPGFEWIVDIHQFRTIASATERGEPTPEGIHRDGDEMNAIHLVNRQNVLGGVSTVYDNDREPLASCVLEQPMDSILVRDELVLHGVTPIEPEDVDRPAIRDVLVIGYNCGASPSAG